MLDILKALILDFQEQELETGVARRTKIEILPRKATVCIGVRRSGKSTYLFQLIQHLLDRGVCRQNVLYVNFVDERLHGLNRADLAKVMEAYFSLYPEKKGVETVFCFFDEIQTVPGWESFVNRIMRSEKCDVYITGSSANMLSREIATQMRGRALTWEIFPFSFREYLDWADIPVSGAMSSKKRLIVQKAFEDFWLTGGFPEVLGLDGTIRIKVHQEYFRAVLFRDLIERYEISHPRALVDLGHRLITNAASLYTINSLTGYLQSLGHKAPKSAVSAYLDWFEDAYFLFSVLLYDASLSRSRVNPKKVYCVDHALITSVTSKILVNTGHLLENLVFTGLRRVTPEVHYYRTRAGHEVDFIASKPDGDKILVQTCESMAEPQTRNREVGALQEAMSETQLATGVIVTRNETEHIETKKGTIEVIPVWRFLLSLDE